MKHIKVWLNQLKFSLKILMQTIDILLSKSTSGLQNPESTPGKAQEQKRTKKHILIFTGFIRKEIPP